MKISILSQGCLRGFFVCDFSKKMNTQKKLRIQILKYFILHTKLYKIYRNVLWEDQWLL